MRIACLALVVPTLVGCCPAPRQPSATTPTIPALAKEPPTSAESAVPSAPQEPTEAKTAPEAPAPAPAPPATLEAPFPEGTDQIARRATELEWGPCPVQISKDCRMAVLEGNPKEPALFTLRFKSKSPFELPVHRHPRHERVTVLEGSIYVAFGETFDAKKGHEFSAGDYYVNRAGAAHTVWTTGPVTGQITGFGPWLVERVKPAGE